MNPLLTNRTDLIKAGLTAIFIAFNKPVQEKLIGLKADLLGETLRNLPDNQIANFFRFIRENCDRMPSDSEMGKLLRLNHKKFLIAPEIFEKIEYKFTNRDLQRCRLLAKKYPAFTDILKMLVEDQPDPPEPMWRSVFMLMQADRKNFVKNPKWTDNDEKLLTEAMG